MIYLDKICEMLDKASDENCEMYFMGDLNIDWFAVCHLRKRLLAIASACNLTQTITLPTKN